MQELFVENLYQLEVVHVCFVVLFLPPLLCGFLEASSWTVGGRANRANTDLPFSDMAPPL